MQEERDAQTEAHDQESDIAVFCEELQQHVVERSGLIAARESKYPPATLKGLGFAATVCSKGNEADLTIPGSLTFVGDGVAATLFAADRRRQCFCRNNRRVRLFDRDTMKSLIAKTVVWFAAASLFATTLLAADKPNILWLTSEDHGPHMGCYGDTYATTPNVDALAAKGLLYAHCWSNAPVCAPARTTLISGLYATSTGGEHMRSMVPFPAGKKMYPQLLREAGYYCTNNAKEDYNLAKPGKVWDESSRKAHWRNRRKAQPFFAVFNSEKSHESQIRTRPHTQVHDPASVRVPAYHPDTPEVRQDWAQYYDGVTAADADAGAAAEGTRGGRPGRRHDRLLFRRSRLGHAAQQALAVQLRPARAAGRLHPREVQGARVRRNTRPAASRTGW